MPKRLPLIPVFIITVFLLTLGCRSEKRTISVPNVNIDDIETHDIKLSELAESFDPVFLETKAEALLNSSGGFAVSDNYILIVDYDQYPAKLFNRSGQFITALGKIGAGPDEYLSVVSPYIDETNDSFWLLLGGNYSGPGDGWFYIYNKKGDLKQKISAIEKDENESNSNEVLVFDNQILIPGNVKSDNMIVYKSLTKKTSGSVPNRINSSFFNYLTNISTIYPVNGHFNFKIGEADTIYSFSIDSGIVKPLLSISTLKHRFDENRIRAARKTRGPGRFANIQQATEGCYSIVLLGETERNYLLSVNIAGMKPASKLAMVDKITGEAAFIKIINDFQNGIPLDKLPAFYQNKYLIFHYSAIEYLNLIKQQQKVVTDKNELLSLHAISDKLKEDDNDILLICKLK